MLGRLPEITLVLLNLPLSHTSQGWFRSGIHVLEILGRTSVFFPFGSFVLFLVYDAVLRIDDGLLLLYYMDLLEIVLHGYYRLPIPECHLY